MSFSNVQNLSTFLNAATGGSPTTTATALVQGLTPIFYNVTGDTAPHYGTADPSAVNTLLGTQGKYRAIVYPATGTPTALSNADSIGLIYQTIKEIIAAGTNPVVALNSGSTAPGGVNAYTTATDTYTWNGTTWVAQSTLAAASIPYFNRLYVPKNLFVGDGTAWASAGAVINIPHTSWSGNNNYSKPLVYFNSTDATQTDMQWSSSQAITWQNTATYSGFDQSSLLAKFISVQTRNANKGSLYDYGGNALGGFAELANIDIAGNIRSQQCITQLLQMNDGAWRLKWNTWLNMSVVYTVVTSAGGVGTIDLTSDPVYSHNIASQLSSAPLSIQCTPINANTAISIVANVTSKTTSLITIQTNQFPAGTPIACTVQVLITWVNPIY